MTFRITIARTAQVFYLVDQLSLWEPHAHKQYARWAEDNHLLGEHERRMLEEHRQLRSWTGGWGALDQAFASTLSIPAAATRAASDGLLTPAQAAQERTMLETFQTLFERSLGEAQSRLEAFRDRLKDQAGELGRVFGDVQTLADTYTPLWVPLFLVFNPTPHGGGGYNGGIVWVEVGDPGFALDTFTHEALHVIIRDRYREIAACADSCGAGLDGVTLNEGLVYAVAPGILSRGVDTLAAAVDSDRQRGRPSSDVYVRYQRLGLALRPILETALSRKDKLGSVLGKACDTWRGVVAEAWP